MGSEGLGVWDQADTCSSLVTDLPTTVHHVVLREACYFPELVDLVFHPDREATRVRRT